MVALIPRLRRYARALTRDPARADDLVQDCLERAWSRSRQWRGEGSARAWLFTIMHNVHVNQVRSDRRSHGSVPLDAVDPPTPDDSATDLRLREVERALDLLSAEHREIVLLVGLEQLSYEEAAEVLGSAIGTVMSRLSRARDRLRVLLEHPASPRVRRVK